MGHHAGQLDPGWWVIRALSVAGLAWDIRTPNGVEQPQMEGAMQ